MAEQQQATRSFGHQTQHQRRRALYTLLVDGVNISTAVDPHLLSIQTIARIGDSDEADVANIELDDREGRLAIPPPEADIEIHLGWSNEAMGLVWKGYVQEVESGFHRRGGARRLWLICRGVDGYALEHARFRQAWGDGDGKEVPLEEVLQQAARAAGLSVRVSPSMRAINKKYWAQQNESFPHFGSRLAKELGGNFKITGRVATMVSATDGLNVDGEKMPTITAEWGVNLIGWRIKPFTAVPQAGKASTVVYDRKAGEWRQFDKPLTGDLPFGLSRSQLSLPAPAATQVDADQWNVGMADSSYANRGIGSITINGEPAAMPDGRVIVKGARAGVDGNYGIDEVEHNYSRTGGYITQINVKLPELTADDIIYGKQWDWIEAPNPLAGRK